MVRFLKRKVNINIYNNVGKFFLYLLLGFFFYFFSGGELYDKENKGCVKKFR